MHKFYFVDSNCGFKAVVKVNRHAVLVKNNAAEVTFLSKFLERSAIRSNCGSCGTGTKRSKNVMKTLKSLKIFIAIPSE